VAGIPSTISNNAINPPAPVAGFTVASTNIFVTQTVVFTNISAGSVTNSAWSFGDGNVTNTSGASVTSNVSNTYINPNTTNMVILTASGPGGATMATNYIVVTPKPVIGTPVLSNGSLIFSISNAVPGAPFVILTCTNLATNVVNWTMATNDIFDVNGAYNYTNPAPTNMASFFRLKSPP
jgi:PKD repeat protein